MADPAEKHLTLREIARTPFYRREAGVVGRRTRFTLYVTAVVLNLAALTGFVIAVRIAGTGRLVSGWEWIVPLATGSILGVVLVAVFATVGLTVPAIAGERESGTLDALVMTPLPRRTLVWAKFLGRTAPIRRFLLLVAPVFALTPAGFLINEFLIKRFAAHLIWKSYLVHSHIAEELGITGYVSSWVVPRAPGPLSLSDAYFLAALALAVLVGALAWFMMRFFTFAVGVAALYASAVSKRTGTAALRAGALVVIAILGVGTVPLFLLMAPILFRRFVKNFDRYALDDR